MISQVLGWMFKTFFKILFTVTVGLLVFVVVRVILKPVCAVLKATVEIAMVEIVGGMIGG